MKNIDKNQTLKASEIYINNHGILRDKEFMMTDNFLIVDEGGLGLTFYNIRNVRIISGVRAIDADDQNSRIANCYPFWDF